MIIFVALQKNLKKESKNRETVFFIFIVEEKEVLHVKIFSNGTEKKNQWLTKDITKPINFTKPTIRFLILLCKKHISQNI